MSPEPGAELSQPVSRLVLPREPRVVSKRRLIAKVHDSHHRLVLAVTGGGSRAVSALLTVPGASRTLLSAHVPYAPAALEAWLGHRPEEFCSARTARLMAMVAYRAARRLEPQAHVLGVSCTASLASDRPKRGPHRAHVAYQSETCTGSFHLQLAKDERSRVEEEKLVARLVLNAVAEACGLSNRTKLPLFDGDLFFEERVLAHPALRALLQGETARVPSGAARTDDLPRALFPGAFHPLHAGHRQMAQVASGLLGTPVAFEISVLNVDKPPLDYVEILQRGQQFNASETLWYTAAPTFERKADAFPGVTFVVGADTIERVGQQRYYGNDPARRDAAIAHLASRDCRFLVFGREHAGQFVGLTDLDLPPALATLCRGVPESAFRADVSSTQLRAAARNQHD